MPDSYALFYVGSNCGGALLILANVFVSNRKGIKPGFRLLPASSREWIIFYFHLVESITLIALQITCTIGGRVLPVAPWIVLCGAWGLLLASGLFVRRWDQSLSERELSFCFTVFLITMVVGVFLLPALQGMVER